MAGPVGSSIGVLTGVAVGGAATVALQPAFEIPRQDAWSRNANKILDVSLLARLVAQGGVDLSAAEDEAKRDGFGPDKLDALVYLEQTVPGIGEAMSLWRRGLITDADFAHTLVKAGLDQRYAPGILKNKLAEPIGLGDIAYAIVRGILPAPSYVPVPVPTEGDKVPRYPTVNVDPEELAALLGYDPQALEILVGRSGLSMAPGMAAQALFRGIIGPNDYKIAIGEGDLRTEWADAVRDVSRAIPSPDQFIEGWLRGWITQADAEAGAAKHGMNASDVDLLYKTKGRPVTFHEITTGLARGGSYPSAYEDIPEPYRKSAQEADMRPEWASLHYANRYLYPSAFVLRALAQAGELGGEADVEKVLLEIGWKPDFAAKVAAAWTAGAAAKADPHVSKAMTTLYTEAHKAYVKDGLAQDQVTPALGLLSVPPSAQQEIFKLWDAEKQLAAATPPAA